MLDVVVEEPVIQLCKGVEDALHVDAKEARLETLVSQELKVVSADGVGNVVPPLWDLVSTVI